MSWEVRKKKNMMKRMLELYTDDEQDLSSVPIIAALLSDIKALCWCNTAIVRPKKKYVCLRSPTDPNF